MGAIVLVFKTAILIGCIRYLLTTSKVLNSALIYAFSLMFVNLITSIASFHPLLIIGLALLFLYNLATGLLYFWLIYLVESRLVLFYVVVLGGVIANTSVVLFLSSLMG